MKPFSRRITIAALCISLSSATALAGEKSLYERLGGYDTLAAVVDDFLARLVKDDQLARLFGGISNDTNDILRQRLVNYFCAHTGGPCRYTGRSMKRAHAGLGMTKDDWARSGRHFGEALNKFNVPEMAQKDFFAIIAPLEKDIVDGNS